MSGILFSYHALKLWGKNIWEYITDNDDKQLKKPYSTAGDPCFSKKYPDLFQEYIYQNHFNQHKNIPSWSNQDV